ncbi:restriction endonuclease subunit S [Neisseria lactamica]|uniref:restriction endonuclease subunit S n=1 Tax=Neisseria lactamica TaxID=486 RepID=UPI000E587A16|nr:restriction endonuclease subunit S [Neisseria lactamica]
MNSALKNHATYINNKVDTNEISLSQYISTDNILQNKQGIECATSLPIQGGKVTAFKKGDILLANIRPYLKKIWYAQFDGGCSADVLAIRANAETDSHFLFYALFRDDFFIHAMKGAKGTKMPRGDKAQIMEFKIPVFDLKTQQSIAAVLSALDKKIALNKQINARLEQMAKTLYDYWFVQFDFPDANGKPYKSSGGEMVFDETLKRKIPKGWKVKSLKDVLVNRSDNIKSEDLTSNMPYTPIDSLPMRKMTFSDFQKIENARTSLIRYSFNDILIGAMRVYFHRVCIAPFDGITRSTTIVLKPKKQNHLPFLYQLCNEEKTINFASKVSIGTQQPYVNWVNGLAEYKFAMPNLELIERYSIKIMPLIKSVITREKQNHHLTQLRDFLLPMLMNGQVSVAE